MRTFLAALASFLLLAFAPEEPAETTLGYSPALMALPLELQKVALDRSCDLTYDHYGDGANFAPPYKYSVLPDLPFQSAVFWCRRKLTSKYSMSLILVAFEEYRGYRDGIYLPRDYRVVSELQTGSPEPICGFVDWRELYGTQEYPLLRGFQRWGSDEWVTLPGRTIVAPIVGLTNAYDSCPVFYFHEGEWLTFTPD